MKKNYSKRFAAWATGLKRNLFLYARLRLSVLYLLAMMLVVGIYSAALFFSLRANIIDDFEDRFKQEDVRAQAVVSTINILEDKIVLADALVLGLMGVLSFLLAGMTLKPIAAALEEQRKFSSDASHELRTPLTVMKTELEVALKSRELTAAGARDIFSSNLEEINRMSALIEDLLLVSRGQARKMPFEKVDLAALAVRLVEKMRPLAEEKSVSLSFLPGSGLVRGNPAFLERMATNIIHNAVSYTPAGGRAEVGVRTGKSGVLFCVSDTGVGIAPENLPRVFDRFHRGGNAGESHGTGLGLSIVKEIAGLHGGILRIESAPGAGTKVFVTFPEYRA
jgi:signal transduction histidine kinase